MPKKYQEAVEYERKLKRVMDRMKAVRYEFDWGRRSCYVEFVRSGKAYRFENSVEALQERGSKIEFGSDAFAVLVLDLESMARMMEHGTFDLEGGKVRGLKELPPPQQVPGCFLALQFDRIPSKVELKKRFNQLVKASHPDVGGDKEWFIAIKQSYDEALKYLEEKSNKKDKICI